MYRAADMQVPLGTELPGQATVREHHELRHILIAEHLGKGSELPSMDAEASRSTTGTALSR